MRQLEQRARRRPRLAELADAEGDEAPSTEAGGDLRARCKERAARAELEALLSGEADGNDAFVEINSGAGGTECQDWAEMLLRMYTRWAEPHGYKVEWLEESRRRAGRDQVGDPPDQGRQRLWLAEDRGRRAPPGAHLALRRQRAPPHQLRLGLGLSGGRRHHRDRDPRQDLRTDTYRASGAGGQHVNKTDSRRAPDPHPDRHRRRLPDRPLAAPEPREAWKMLRARLYELELQKREAPRPRWRPEDRHRLGPPDPQLRPAALPDGQGPAHRGRDRQPAGVLDGDLDRFLEAALAEGAADRRPEGEE